MAEPASIVDQRSRFIAFTNLASFSAERGSDPRHVVLTSPEIACGMEWDELVVSWNMSADTALEVEARALADGWSSRFYHLGHWSLDRADYPRTSVNGQNDGDGVVRTDTLVVSRRASGVQVRLTLHVVDATGKASVKFLGMCFLNSAAPTVSLAPDKSVWGKVLSVPERNQLDYEGGRDWCSPTSVSMVLAYWAEVRQRQDWRVDVAEVARRVDDPGWGGTGNWCFNTAFAGSLAGIRAYVTRLDDLAEVETWIASGVPVVLSVSFDLLRKRPQDNGPGHLVVCAGFTETGDVILNDPWAPEGEGRSVRRVHSRAEVLAAWGRSRNTVYLIYPEGNETPPSRWGHW